MRKASTLDIAPDVKEAIQGAAKAVFGSVAEEEKLEALFDAVQEGDSGMA